MSKHSAKYMQVGTGNTMQINETVNNITIGELQQAIEKSSTSPEQKAEAQSLLQRILEHPAIGAFIAGITSGTISTLSK